MFSHVWFQRLKRKVRNNTKRLNGKQEQNVELEHEISYAGCITFWNGEQKVCFNPIFDTLHHCCVAEVCPYSQCDGHNRPEFFWAKELYFPTADRRWLITRDSHAGCVPAAICGQKEIGHCLSMLQGEEMKQMAD